MYILLNFRLGSIMKETVIQQELISCCNFLEQGFIEGLEPVPELGLIFHIVNEGKRSPAEGARLKRMGMRSGVPDLCFPIKSACGKYSSLFIEMKNENGHLSESQIAFIKTLRESGNRVVMCRTSKKALFRLMEHLNRVDVMRMIDEDFSRIKNPIL